MTQYPDPMPMLKLPEAMPRAMSPDSAHGILLRFYNHITHGAAWNDRIEDVAQAAFYNSQLRPSTLSSTVQAACLRIANDRERIEDLMILKDYTKSIFTP